MTTLPRIVRGRTEMIVPYNQGELSIIYPQVGPGNYQTVGTEIIKQKLNPPHGEYTVPLLHAAC
ncbi:MAG TPA: hypothetical protein VJK51_02765 [Candidatus Nanoarchaeia archaeon]|nr:hypothetical protein [Candidatus Nanoarchaeia archaeon]